MITVPSTARKSCTYGLLALLIAAGLLLTSTVAMAQAAPARLVEDRGANRLELPSGAQFHRTANPVQGLRTLDVRGASLQVHTWDETLPSGASQSFYAVSRDGNALLGRVRPTTHIVRLRHERFDPVRQGPPESRKTESRKTESRTAESRKIPPMQEARR